MDTLRRHPYICVGTNEATTMYTVTINPEELTKLIQSAVKDAIAVITKTTSPRDYLSVAEAAAYMKVSKGTITNWISEGAIPFKQYGRVKRVLRQDLDELMD